MEKLSTHVRRPLFAGSCCLLAGIIWCMSSPVAQAIPLSDYHNNVKRSITALDSLAVTNENETTETYERRFVETVKAVREILPKSQMVETHAGLCSVENSWLQNQLDVLLKTAAARRPVILAQVLERLSSLEVSLTELENAALKDGDKPAEKERLRSILGRSEYAGQSKSSGRLMQLLRDLIRWIQSFLPKRAPLAPSQAHSLVRFAQILVIGVASAVIVYVLWVFFTYLVRRKKRREKTKPEVRIVLGEELAPDESAKDLLAEAESLALSGQLRAAIRKGYIALLVELGERKLISLAHHKTNRDYLRSVRTQPVLYKSMSGLTDSFERHWYGFASVSTSDWQEFRAGYHAALQIRD